MARIVVPLFIVSVFLFSMVFIFNNEDMLVSGDPIIEGEISPGEYDFNGTFGEGGLVEFHWKVLEDKIYFAMVGKTSGWVSIGIDYKKTMEDSDMIFGWIEDDGTVKVADTYSTGPVGPHPPDTDLGGTDDIIESGGREINGITTIEFVRKLDTGDEFDNPIPINDTPLKIIWAIGNSDDINSKHVEADFGTINILTGETTTEEKIELWPIHAIFMTLGAGMMVLATLVLYRRKWKLFFKFHMWVMTIAIISAMIGTVTGVIMVENSTGIHFRVIHSWLGPLTMMVSILAHVIGLYFKYTKKIKHKKSSRTIHRYAGWAGAVLFVATTVSGFIQALVNADEEAPVWFIITMVVILTALVAAAIYVILKGRK